MQKLIVAFATDDGKIFMERHFGDGLKYEIYQVGTSELNHLKTVSNSVEDGEKTSDSIKARGIAGLLKKQGVQVLVSKKFGPNINRMKTKFVCLLMNDASIAKSIDKIQNEFGKIVAEWQKGEQRHFLNWKS